MRILSQPTLLATVWVAVVAFTSPTVAQEYVLSFSEESGAPGDSVGVTAIMDTTDGDPLSGFQFGVCHDTTILTLDEIVPLDTADFDTTFCARTPQDGGWTCGYLMNVITGAMVEPDLYNLIRGDYTIDEDAEENTTTDIEYCGTLGSPMVSVALISGGSDLTPDQEIGTVSIVGATPFLRGDCNDSGDVLLTDAIVMISALFEGGSTVDCDAACDANADGMFSMTDALFTLEFIFTEGPEPAAPFGLVDGCGVFDGQTPEDCVSHTACE